MSNKKSSIRPLREYKNKGKQIKTSKISFGLLVILLVITIAFGGTLACKKNEAEAPEEVQTPKPTAEKVVEEEIEVDSETLDAIVPKSAGDVVYKNYSTPEFSNEITIENFLKKEPVWYMVGLAENSRKTSLIDEEEANFRLEDFEDTAYTVVFYPDGKLKIYADIIGIPGVDESKYEIVDNTHCVQEPDEEGAGWIDI